MKTMDMYLIGGQSNAVGYSPMNDTANVPIGADRCHFNVRQMHRLGNRLADAILHNVLDR